MYLPIEVVNYLYLKYKKENIQVNMLKLMHLCYLAQAWSLGINNKPLFTDSIEKWKGGMIIPSLYKVLKVFHSENIQVNSLLNYNVNFYKKDLDILDLVFKSYSSLSALQLYFRVTDSVYECTDLHKKVNLEQVRIYYNHKYNIINNKIAKDTD